MVHFGMSTVRIRPTGASVKSSRQAFQLGLRWAFDAPMWVLFAGMLGIGALGRSQGLSDAFMVASSVLVFAQPGQIVLMDMLAAGAAAVPIALAVGLTSARFFAMGVSLFPQLHPRHRGWFIIPAAHMLSMTTWALCMRAFDNLPRRFRWHFYLGVGVPCFLISLPGTWLGFHLAGRVPEAVALTLVMLNPLFFAMTFAQVSLPINRWASGLGAALMPMFNQLDAGSSLLFTALVGGSLAYAVQRWRERRASRIQDRS